MTNDGQLYNVAPDQTDLLLARPLGQNIPYGNAAGA